jgi:hypothetical protein
MFNIGLPGLFNLEGSFLFCIPNRIPTISAEPAHTGIKIQPVAVNNACNDPVKGNFQDVQTL